jgi:YD repeat-containing protein
MSKFTLAMLLLAAAGEAGAAAARVDFAYGTVTVSGPDGREQPLLRGAELDNGDTVRTADGRAQLRFRDGAYVSLQPGSEFAIRDYRFDGKTDGAERGFFGLAKGAMRTVTGLIGRVNRDRYQVSTPTATIGIRGTGGVIQVLDDGSTLIVGTSGIWSLTNPTGSVDVPAGVSALAPSTPDAPPRRTSQAPQAPPPPLLLPAAYVQGEQRDANGNLLDLITAKFPPPAGPPPELPPVTGFDVVFTYDRPGLEPDIGSDVTVRFNSSGQFVQADNGSLRYKLDPVLGTHADFGTDGILTWGRWIGPVELPTGSVNYSASQGFHYVVGLPTITLPTNGVTATYELAGSTIPTYVDGRGSTDLPTRTFSGSLTVTFDAQARITGVFQADMRDRVYAWNGSGATTTANFSLATTPVSGCVGSCVIKTDGFFAGAAAQRVGLGYTIVDSDASVVGAAAFRRQ